MRQVLVLGLLAVLGWWLYGAYIATPAEAKAPDAGVGGGSPGAEIPGGAGQASGNAAPVNLADVLGTPAPQGGQSGGGRGAPPREASSGTGAVALDAAGQQALDRLLGQIEQADPAAMSQGWAALASRKLPAGLERRIAGALQKEGSFAAMLEQLGASNAFLHSGEGRAYAEKVFAKGLAQPDAEAVAAGTKFLDLCLRGRIEKTDAPVRALVDRCYAQYRIRAERWLCDPQNVAGARSYTVVGGDSLNGIAKRFRREGILVDEGTIAVLNRIQNKNAIQKGQHLKIPIDPIHAVVEKRSFSLAVYVGDDLLRLYWVGHGQNDKTPVTEFIVGEKEPRPQWTAPDGRVLPYGHPENILGEYWIQLKNDYKTGFGAHGTPMPETICTMSSDGCVRMLAPDIAELFEILPRGARFEVRASESL